MNNRYDDEEDENTTLPPTVVFQIVVDTDDHQSNGPRPNAYWAAKRIADAEEADLEPDNFGGGFRGVRAAPHGGQVTVKPEQVIGSDDLCWCGQPTGHDWPGKASGRKHPKEATMNTQVATTVDRRDLRAYHARLQDFIIQCVNEDGLRFRIGANSTLLYPPDGTQPATVYARNSDRQVKQLQKWYVTHVYPSIEKPEKSEAASTAAADAAALAKLAEKVNDPVEHPPAKKAAAKKVVTPPPPVAPPAAKTPRKRPDRGTVASGNRESQAEREARHERNHRHTPDQWRPYERENGPSPTIETDGKFIRCITCEGTDHPLLTENPRSIGGHNRIYHTDTTNLYDADARARAAATQRASRMKGKIEEAMRVLVSALGEDSPDAKIAALTKELADVRAHAQKLEADLEAARKNAGDAEALVAATKRADEAEARLALMREALTA